MWSNMLKYVLQWVCCPRIDHSLTPFPLFRSQQVSLSHSMSVAHNSRVWRHLYERSQSVASLMWGHRWIGTQSDTDCLALSVISAAATFTQQDSRQIWYNGTMDRTYDGVWRVRASAVPILLNADEEWRCPKDSRDLFKLRCTLQNLCLWAGEPLALYLPCSVHTAKGDWCPQTTHLLNTQQPPADIWVRMVATQLYGTHHGHTAVFTGTRGD